MCTKNHNHMRYILKLQSETDRTFCHFGPVFALLHPNNPENQNYEKMKSTSGDDIVLQMFTKNHDQMMYAS